MAESASARAHCNRVETLRREMNRLFDDFDGGFWRSPLCRSIFDVQPSLRREVE